MQSCLSSRSKH